MAIITYDSGNGNWATGSNWIGGVTPGASDTADFDAASGNCTVDADIVVGKITATSYGGTLDFNGYDVEALGGIDGFDGNLTWGSGDVTVSTILKVESFTSGTGKITLTGSVDYYGTDFTDGKWSSFTVAAGATVNAYEHPSHAGSEYLITGGTITINGTLDNKQAVYALIYATSGSITIGSTGVLLASASPSYMILSSASNCTCNGTITGTVLTYGAHTLAGDWTSATSQRVGLYGSATITFAASFIGDSLSLEAGAATNFTFAFTAGAEVQGDVTTTTGGGSITITGTMELTGTGNQDIDHLAADATGLAIVENKTSGNTTLAQSGGTIEGSFGSGSLIINGGAADVEAGGTIIGNILNLAGNDFDSNNEAVIVNALEIGAGYDHIVGTEPTKILWDVLTTGTYSGAASYPAAANAPYIPNDINIEIS